MESTSTILTLLETQVDNQPDAKVLTLLHNGETPAGSLTYRQLAQQARRVAAYLLRSGVTPGERVLLVYAEGLEFLPAFLGCLYAGVVAVPTPAPDALRSKRALPHMQAVYADAGACLILTTERLKEQLPATPELPILSTDHLHITEAITDELVSGELVSDELFDPLPVISPHQLAYLQYTSGSTGTPKGVMISHANVLANLEGMHQVWPYTPDAVAITWMPHTHDFGLVGGLLRPVLCGVPSYIMSPGAFLRKPLRWLRAISSLRVTHCGGASFAFQQCLQQFDAKECDGLDLSCWQMGVLGAEPIRADVLEDFAATFAPYGFARNTYCPAYGLAEGTLMVTARGPSSHLTTRHMNIEGRTTVLTGCGQPWSDTDVRIVDPATQLPAPAGQVGEIWIAGSTVTTGYWGRPEETRETFGNALNGINYMRTGDLGLMEEDVLYVTGRLKDLIIIHGQNYYPQDIEWSVETAHPILKNGNKAAFAIDEPLAAQSAERLVLICEIDPKIAKTTDLSTVVEAIREQVGTELLLTVHVVALVKRGMLPKTPSGKVQRRASRMAWLNEELETLFTWKLDRAELTATGEVSSVDSPADFTPPQTPMEELLAQIWCEVLEIPAVSVTANFFAHGGNSLLLMRAYNLLCEKLDRFFPPVDLFTYPDIRSLAQHLSGEEETDSGMAQVQERVEKQLDPISNESILDGIAVIGLAGRFPGARNVEDFWANLKNGVESIRQFTDEELQAAGVEAELLRDPRYVKAGAVLDNIDTFDATFFGMSSREAAITDPQQRLFLECAWEACEYAGYDPKAYPGSIGVFAGAGAPSYRYNNLAANQECWKLDGAFQIMLGNEKDYLATRTSYRLGLRGPSITVQTACSTSLVATHLACRSLLNNECEMALAGGVSLQLPQGQGYLYEEGGIFSPDGHCRTFDADARGTIFGSGAGVVLLKRLPDALRDGDPILALIKGTAINNDGATKVGFTAPGVPGQAEAIAAAVGVADVPFDAISYIETHGTATALGDPIEIEALTRAFRTQTRANGFCAIGSVKSNIGHLDAAAGVAGLIKTVLALKHRQLPPSLHFNTPNPHIDFVHSPFYVNTTLVDWNTTHAVRTAGVSAFGLGGTNSHVILTEAPPQAPSGPARPWLLLPLSARTPKALEEMTAKLAAHLRAHPDLSLPDVAYTLQVGRHSFASRRLLLCRSAEEALQSLENPTAETVWTQEEAPSERRVVFLFPGQGIDLVNQGRELYETEGVFREQIDRCAGILREWLGTDLREVLYPTPDREAWAKEQMGRTALAQPAIFVLEYALAQQWGAWGVHPAAMIGHSLGEYVAACLSGVFSLEDGLRLVAARGRIMQAIPPGAMLAVALPESEMQNLLNEDCWLNAGLSLAAVNAPRQCILSGEVGAIEQVEAILGERGITCVRLATSHAFHSEMMEEAIAPLTGVVCELTLGVPQIPYMSNVTGSWAHAAEVMSADYWGRHLRQAVRYGAGIEQLNTDFPNAVFLEVGPGTVLTKLTGLVLGKNRCTTIPSLPGIKGLSNSTGEAAPTEAAETNSVPYREEKALMEAVGRLWLEGVTVGWRNFSSGQQRLRVPLPTYPFQKRRHWIEPDTPSTFPGNDFALNNGTARPDEEEAARQSEWPVAAKKRSADTREADIANWFYVPAWTHSPLLPPHICGAEPTADTPPYWIVFAEDSLLSAHLIQRLKRQGQTVVEVYRGARFEQQEPGRFTLSPANSDDYSRLIQESGAQHSPNLRILHLWNLNNLRDPAVADPLQTSRELGFSSLLALARALQSAPRPKGRVPILMVTQHLCDVRGDEMLEPEKAILLGSCLVIPQEHPDISCSCIDVTPPANATRADWLVDQLLAESVRETRELLIAYRGKRRWLQDYRPISIAPQVKASSLQPEGVYLITGGLGEIGLALAEHLARTARARLVLVGRTAFPPRDEWEEWLRTHSETEPMSVQLQRLIALEGVASSVKVVSADVAEPGQLQQVVDSIYNRFGVLHGVFHAAGVVRGDNAFSQGTELGAETIEMHFRPKILGLQALEQALRGRSVDFCVLFGSNSAVLGGFGFSAYAAGNAFMNAFAEDRSRESDIRWICVNWDAWRTAGLATSGLSLDLVQNMAITEAEGMAVLDRVLSGYPSGPIVVSATDLTARLDLWVRQKSGAHTLGPKESESDNAQPRENIKTSYVAPTSDTERILVEMWQDCLGIAPIGIRDEFFDLGGDSLLAVRLMTLVQNRFQRTLPLANFVFDPTIAHLAAELDALQPSEQPLSEGETQVKPQAAMLSSASADDVLNENSRLRQLYDELGQPGRMNLLRDRPDRPFLQSRLERLIQRLPLAVAFPLLRQLVRLPRAQQKYWALPAKTMREFHQVIDTPVDVTTLIETSLLYNLLHSYGFDQRYLDKPTLNRVPGGAPRTIGLELLEQAKTRGRGVILAGAHSLGLVWLPLEEHVQAAIFGIDQLISQEQLPLEKYGPILFTRQLEVVVQTLQRGETVGIFPDGGQGSGSYHEVHFHGRQYRFHTTFAELALLTGATVLPVMGELRPGRPITVRLFPPLDAGDETMPHAMRVERLCNQYAEILADNWRTMPWGLNWNHMWVHVHRRQ